MTDNEKLQSATAATNYLSLIATAAISNIRLGEHNLNGADEDAIKDLVSTAEKIGSIAVNTLGIDYTEAERLKAQANAMAGLKGNPTHM